MRTLHLLFIVFCVNQGERQPSWTKVHLAPPNPDFVRERKALEGKTFTIADAIAAKNAAAKAKYLPRLSFRALMISYLAGTDDDVYERCWTALPEGDLEVARLHFLWDQRISHQHWLASLGEELLDRNPKDVEVLCKLVLTKLMVEQSFRDAKIARIYADRALKLESSARTYYAIAWSRMYHIDNTNNTLPTKADGAMAKKYFTMYLDAKGPKPRRAAVESMIKWLEKRGY